MRKILPILCVLYAFCNNAAAQIIPREGAELNYRIVPFMVPSEPKTQNYTFEIATGYYNSEDSFKANIFKTSNVKTNRMLEEVPAFGARYTWRVIYRFGKSSKTTTALFHFNTGIVAEVDTNSIHLKITKAAAKYSDAYVFVDGNRVLYDMSGAPVWYLPNTDGRNPNSIDLKISPQGTITFLSGNAYEVDYNGTVLWKSPNAGCHHEFTRLKSGHYMTLEMAPVISQKMPDSTFQIAAAVPAKNAPQTLISRLVEYNDAGNVAWQWSTADYFSKSDLVNFKSGTLPIFDAHENSFCFDEKNNAVFLNYKNLSRIVKIKYPEGTVVRSYGAAYSSGGKSTDNHLYCGEHGVKQSDDGSLFIFNNNSCKPSGIPIVEKLKEPEYAGNELEMVWQYECNTQTTSLNGFSSGGNVMELEDSVLFISTASPDSRLLIVNMNNDILWSAQSEKWDGTKWDALPRYRASIISSRTELENLIWNSVKKSQQF